MAKIMSLVDPKILERFTAALEPVNPLYTVSWIMTCRTVLQRTDLTDRKKVKKYNNVLQRYLEYQDHHRFPTEQPIQHHTATQSIPTTSMAGFCKSFALN